MNDFQSNSNHPPSSSESDRTELTRLRQQLAESTRNEYLLQRQFARALQEKNQLNQSLLAAVHELHIRLRMLLRSRLLHMGWKIGLGRTPYWNNPAADELNELIELANASKAVDSKSILQKLQTALARQGSAGGGGDMESALDHLLAKGFSPAVVLDIGAAKGYWSINAGYRWKNAEFFMIDPLQESEAELQRICQDNRFHYLRVAVGDQPGEAAIHVANEPDSSSLMLTPVTDPASHRTVDVCTIDQLIESNQIKPAQLVKIDVQGFEMKVLVGATKLFASAEVFIIEANLFEFMPGCPRVHELIAFMAERGFYPFDFAGFLRRPFENDLGQIDIVFVNRTSPMVASNRWLEAQSAAAEIPLQPELDQQRVISVIICTANPQPAILDRTLDALEKQTLNKDRFEVIVMDNASRLPVEEYGLKNGRTLAIRLVREPISGLARARCTGIANSTGALLVFVDDDNFLSLDYLEQSLAIAKQEPRIGLFGGISEAELETPIANWKKPALDHLGVRNYGNEPITKFADHWGMWEPIGAGMVARRAVAERFVQMCQEIPQALLLGRTGSVLLSGEDSLFARAAFRAGFACSYQPALRLTHFIKAARLRARYIGNVIEGHGRSYVILQRALQKPVEPLKTKTAVARLLFRLKDVGLAGFLTGRWEMGYARECQNPSQLLAVQPRESISLSPATLAVSVVLCTRNPRADLLQQTIDSIDRQNADCSDFELIIVDNASTPPVDSAGLSAGLSIHIRVISEPKVGHTFARCAGIRASKGELIVFVDDDNFLDPDYLGSAISIAKANPDIGAFGGIADAQFEKRPRPWQLSLLKFLAVRDHGSQPITSTQDEWGPWEPIGAGMVIRRQVAERFVQWIGNLPADWQLGRSDRKLLSGDDALFSRAAHRMGYTSSYQPMLRLTHHIKPSRFGIIYLCRLLHGLGRTHVLINQTTETPVPRVSAWQTLKRLFFRLKTDGAVGFILWCWDAGQYTQQRGLSI